MLSTVDMVVQRRDGPRRLRDHDDDDDEDYARPSLPVFSLILLLISQIYFRCSLC